MSSFGGSAADHEGTHDRLLDSWSPEEEPRRSSLFDSYNYQAVRLSDRHIGEQAGPTSCWFTVSMGLGFGLLAVICVMWSGVGQGAGRPLVAALSTGCLGEGCREAFDCQVDADQWTAKWSEEKKAWCLSSDRPEHTLKAQSDFAFLKVVNFLGATTSVHPATPKALKDSPEDPPPLPDLAALNSTNDKTAAQLSTARPTTTTTTTTTRPTTSTTSATIQAMRKPDESLALVPRLLEPLKGISYCPVPVKAPMSLKSDDFMAEASKPLWAAHGRGDLRLIRQLGANAVRLYGNNPELDHRGFLDEAHKNKLRVIPGMSDFPYFQDKEQSCQMTQYNCYAQAKKQYALNLKHGFMTPEKKYHPALLIFNLINEPDLKMPQNADVVQEAAFQMARAIISAFDAVLDAEREAGLVDAAVNFTATISFALCPACPAYTDAPALGQMALIEDAMRNPDAYGYHPVNDLAANYRRRWVNSFNTANDAKDLKEKFFDRYEQVFTHTPVFIGEYHNLLKPVAEDLKDALDLATERTQFLGISFFEFQVAYWKGGSEMAFGLFQLGGYPITKMHFLDDQNYTVWCLQPSSGSGVLLPNALAQAFGGRAPNVEELCLPQPDTVPLSTLGYNLISGLKDQGKLAAYLQRIGEHMGGEVVDAAGLSEFAKIYLGGQGPGFQFEDVVKDMPFSPWLKISGRAACVADRNASVADVEVATSWGCAHLEGFSCDDISAECLADPFAKGDWVFSRYYPNAKLQQSASLEQCNFGGAAIYASPSVHQRFSSACVLKEEPPAA